MRVICLLFSCFWVFCCLAFVSMRTKSRAVRRHSVDQTFEGDGSVGVGVSGYGHDLNDSANSGTIVQDFDGDAPFTGYVTGDSVSTGDVPATFGMLMDVDDELRSVNGTVERASAVTAVVASVGSSKGIVINEPDMCRSTVTNDRNRFPKGC